VLAKDTIQLAAVALGYDDKPMGGRTFTWTSSNTAVATVDANGRAAFLRAGSATFTAKSAFTTSTVTVNALERQFLAVTSGDDYTCGFTNLGRGYCWGVGDLGLLASAADSTCFDAGSPGPLHPCTLLPKRFAGPAIEFTAMDAGVSSACAISKDKLIYCWGSDSTGQIGNGGKGTGAQAALATVAQERFDSITVGGSHACALNLARKAYCWGRDNVGQLGDRRVVYSTTPIPVSGNLVFSAIAAGENHTCGISNGSIYCWGGNDKGQLGNGTVDGNEHSTPQQAGGASGYVAISAGGDHTCAITSAGSVVCWGGSESGESGAAGAPITSPTTASAGPYTRVSAGRRHTCAMTAAGAMACWGDNGSGQIGNGGLGGIAGVSAVSTGVTFKAISAGTNHTCAIGTDGETYCWGSNVFGALGNELQAAFRTSPEKVAIPR
jgi:alpha-tubulin suppressor-like RCC1 family protein